MCPCVRVHVRVRACVRAYVRACVRACLKMLLVNENTCILSLLDIQIVHGHKTPTITRSYIFY